jgi:hydroxymethylglutaryl-CoA reductase
MTTTTSRIPGFHREALPRRRELVAQAAGLVGRACAHLGGAGQLDVEIADHMSENVISVHGLPLSVALNFRVNGREVLVPMATEEPSVVAAASNAARLVRLSGGFVAEGAPPIMTAQVQLDDVPHPRRAVADVMARAGELRARADAAIPRMVARGGGCVDLDARILDLDAGVVVIHLHVDVRDAMGANVVDTVAEAVGPSIARLTGGRLGLRILTNLPDRRIARARCRVTDDVLGAELADGVVRASRFASLDPYRAVTHNKGIMNGVDAVAVALGQDWRALEAGAHAFAAAQGRYRPLAVWRRDEGGVVGEIALPMAVGTVGGAARAHPGVRSAFEIVAVSSAVELSAILAAVGLASNLAALRALAGEGIQRGHMRLHRRAEETPVAAAQLAPLREVSR